MSLDYDLDEVEASIRRCEEFISQNDCNIGMLQRRLKENSGINLTQKINESVRSTQARQEKPAALDLSFRGSLRVSQKPETPGQVQNLRNVSVVDKQVAPSATGANSRLARFHEKEQLKLSELKKQ